MKMNKELKIEGIVIGICFILMLIGLFIQYSTFCNLRDTLGLFVLITSSPLFVLVVISAIFYWIWKVYKY